MVRFFRNHPDVALWLFFTGLATFVLFFISPDSYLNDMHTRCDSAWFFMCGKAWMNGQVPYIDFSDSKGPLLWLIYGIGYLLSRTSYLGIFWISCFWYGLTYFLSYKTAYIFLKDYWKSICCAVLMTLAFFNPWFHGETRAEDFCHLFLMLSLYWTCILLYTKPEEKKALISFGVQGACFAALFLIKFNIAAMQSVLILISLVYLIKEKKNWLRPLLFLAGGAIIVILPFFIYFLSSGTLTAFIQEYILNTLHTVDIAAPSGTNLLTSRIQSKNLLITYLLEWGDLVYCPELATRLVFLLTGGILFLLSNKEYRWMPLVASFLVFALCVRHHFFYYFNSCSFLLVFLYISLFSLPKKHLPKYFTSLCMLVTIGILIPAHILFFNFKILFFNNNINQKDYYKVSYIISQVHQPTIINANDQEFGYGVWAEALPAGKYWSRQTVMTQEMQHEHTELILSGKADFIVINQRFIDRPFLDYPDIITQKALDDAGYAICCRFGEAMDYLLLSKHKDLDIPESISLSRKDLFLKKKPTL